jgi:hypothetical protein
VCNIQAVPRSLKRRRGVEGSADEETKKGKVAKIQPAYNSQLLRPQETAITRSTKKYTSRAKKSSPIPSRSDTDFDAIPLATRAPMRPPKPDPLPKTKDVAPLKAIRRKEPESAGKPKAYKPSGKKSEQKGTEPVVSNRPNVRSFVHTISRPSSRYSLEVKEKDQDH